MPLYAVNPDGLKKLTGLPYKSNTQPIIDRIPHEAIQAIRAEINRLADLAASSGEKQLFTAGWLPGSDWTGTVWEPIYEACGCDVDLSGRTFGALVFFVMTEREEDWSFGRYEVDGREIGSNTYFRIGAGS
jgi:hypothetical protein